jgi:alpha-tubulin suppressor-like RCC1 family protein
MACGKRHSALLTSSGAVWMCGNYKTDKQSKTQEVEKQIQKDKEFAMLIDESTNPKKGSKKGQNKKDKKRKDEELV